MTALSRVPGPVDARAPERIPPHSRTVPERPWWDNRWDSARAPLCQRLALRYVAKVALTLVLIVSPARAQARLTEDQTLGRYLSGYMTAVGITQDSLARMLPWLGSSQSARVNRLSAIRAGAVSASDSELVRIGRVVDSLFRARLDASAELRAYRIVGRVRPIVRPAPPPSAPVGPAPTPAPTPVRTVAIASGRMYIDNSTYWLEVTAHGLANGARVIVRDHAATPSFDGQTLFVRITSSSGFTLWRDSARTQSVIATARGGRGTLEVLP